MPEGGLRRDPLPYARHAILPEDVQAVAEVLGGSHVAQGPEAAGFEHDLAAATGAAHAVSVSSGTAALHVALRALGVGPGDEVIVPACTFLATANAVLFCGARPVFADVDPGTLCLDPTDVARRISPRTRGAVPVHFAGHPADTAALADALGPGRFLLEDACHALGATRDGTAAGTLGDAACFSFHPAKHVTTGEGGAVTTDDAACAERLRALRSHGVERRPEHFRGLGLPAALAAEERGAWVYEMHDLAPNYRLAELGAALGRSQLRRLPENLERRRGVAAAYREGLRDLDVVALPAERPGCRSAWHLYVLRLRVEALRGGRAEFFAGLRRADLGVQVHYIPVHLQPWYRKHQGTAWGDLPVTEDAYLRSVSLPMFPGLGDEDVARVVEAVRTEAARLRR